MSPTTYYLGSILLEPARWQPGRPATVKASGWAERAAAGGFAGWELWENHWLLADERERSALREGPLPVRLFNTYASFDPQGRDERSRALGAVRDLPEVVGMKFNVGNVAGDAPAYKAAIEECLAGLPARAALLCECHPGTLLETPEGLRAFAAGYERWPFTTILHPFLESPERIRAWFALAGKRLAHAHVQMRALGDSRRFVKLTDDKPRALECLAALREGGFAGSFTLEFSAPTLTADDRPEALFRAACEDLAFLQEHWRPAP